MALTPEQQAFEHMSRAKRIFIVSKEHASHDAIASALACSLFLKKMGKACDIVIPGIDINQIPSFLPNTTEIRPTVGAMRSFQITLNVKNVPLDELMYDVKDEKLEITVVPKTGEWSPNDVTFKHGDDRYDLVVALDSPDMHSLGALARDHADFLYRTTIINIDRDVANEHWGQINIVDLNGVSTTEVLFGLFERWNRHLIDERIATALLAGMIAKTKSFRTTNVTPKTLATASQLVAMGAKREEIVHGLWRTRTVPVLKLWGRALARLEQNRELGLVWTTLSRQDFIESGSTETTLTDVVDELIGYAPEAKVVAFIYESDLHKGPRLSIHALAPFSATELIRPFGGTGTRDQATCQLTPGTTFAETSKSAIEQLTKTLTTIQK